MTIIRDFYCLRCGKIHPDRVVEMSQVTDRGCDDCGPCARLEAVCNGGLRSRYRFADWDEAAVESQMQYRGIGACTYDADGNEQPITEADGSQVIHRPEFGGDAMADRKDQWRFKARKKRGREKIFIDSKQRP